MTQETFVNRTIARIMRSYTYIRCKLNIPYLYIRTVNIPFKTVIYCAYCGLELSYGHSIRKEQDNSPQLEGLPLALKKVQSLINEDVSIEFRDGVLEDVIKILRKRMNNA